MERISVNLKTGVSTVIQMTVDELAVATENTRLEKIGQDAERLVGMKAKAEDAELRKTIDIVNGTTTESVDYRAEKTRQGK